MLTFHADACKTYEFTWAIREASERSRAATLAMKGATATVVEEAVSEESEA